MVEYILFADVDSTCTFPLMEACVLLYCENMPRSRTSPSLWKVTVIGVGLTAQNASVEDFSNDCEPTCSDLPFHSLVARRGVRQAPLNTR